VQVWLLEAEAWSVERITSGALAVVWLVFIAYWTIGSIRAGAPVAFTLFSLPFWICGAMMVDPVLVPLRRTILWHADLQSLRAYSPYSRTRARRHACIVRHSRRVSGRVVFDPFHPSAFGCRDRRHRQSTQPLPPHACAHAVLFVPPAGTALPLRSSMACERHLRGTPWPVRRGAQQAKAGQSLQWQVYAVSAPMVTRTHLELTHESYVLSTYVLGHEVSFLSGPLGKLQVCG
jgi:hypothetical protein